MHHALEYLKLRSTALLFAHADFYLDIAKFVGDGSAITVAEPENVTAAMGVGINCPDGMPFCRKALRRIGKRSLARRERRDAKNQEMSETMASVDVVIQDLKKDTRYFGSMELQTFQQSIQKIVSEYLHDYSDEEICSDIGMCSVGNNPGQLPIAKSAFDTIRL